MKKNLLSLFAIAMIIATITKAQAQINTQDSLTLVDLYQSTKGTKWLKHSNWLTTAPVGIWYGITVNNNRVTSIDLSQNILNGKIPSSLGNLTELTSLILDNNKLNDTIPSSLGNLVNLNWLSLYANQLSGVIPSSLGNLSNLQHLDLGFNSLSGIIPGSISNLINLTYLFLASNNLSGSIPSSFGNLQNLSWLYLYNNQFNDTIPSSLGNLSQLTRLIIFGNKLKGKIPTSLGNLKKLETLHLFNNQLSGSIPSSLNNLAYITTITLNGNRFTFDGMEDLINQFPYFVTYSPQALVPLDIKNNVLSVSVGGTPSNDTFRWYRDSVLIVTNVGDSTYKPTAPGKYCVAVTNSIATQLKLYSDTFIISNLPIKNIKIEAKPFKGQLLLQWQTIDEFNAAWFSIQHSSNGTTFNNIVSKDAFGIGNNTYEFIDRTPVNGINYYRLLIFDKDGKSTFSKVVSVNFYENQSFSITPNPAKDFVTISFSKTIDRATIVVYDITGKAICTQSINEGTNAYNLNTQALTNGVFVIKVKTATGSYNQKFLINK